MVPAIWSAVLRFRAVNAGPQRDRSAGLRHAGTEESWSFPPSFLGLSPEDTETGELPHVSEDQVEFREAGGVTRQLNAVPWPFSKLYPGAGDFQKLYWLLADEASGRLSAGRPARGLTYRVFHDARLRIISVGK